MSTVARARGLDALLPPEMAGPAEAVGVRKASLDAVTLLALAVLAGAPGRRAPSFDPGRTS